MSRLSDDNSKPRLRNSILELALIFFGITLALAFENWNTERTERRDEVDLLIELRSNLENNVAQLESNIEFNKERVADLTLLLLHIESRNAWSSELVGPLDRFRYWASPYLTSSAYETLKSRGLDLIAESALREKIVHLFDVEYASLANDYDQSEWINFEISMTPQSLRHIQRTNGDPKPIDYQAMLDDVSFNSAIRTTRKLRRFGIDSLKQSKEATEQVIESISLVLAE